MPMDDGLAQATSEPAAGFQIAFVDVSGSRHQEPLATGWPVRTRAAGQELSFPAGPAQLSRAVVVRHERRACGLRVVARTRARDAARLRPCRGRVLLTAVLAAVARR